jgi:glycosyltransferase involved in cell wall biosynthesis
MAGLDVLWHPATSEGLGTAVIDAMALGIPPVAFSVGGLPELIIDGECGILVPPGDVSAFAEAATRLVRDPALRKQLGSAGPARASKFSVEQMADGTAKTYATVLGLGYHTRRRQQRSAGRFVTEEEES